MFTGIINHLGKVAKEEGQALTISADRHFLAKIKKGTSIAVNGICLTAVKTNKNSFEVNFMPETKKCTNIAYLQINDLVNLELPATPNTFLSGHIVQGHIDGISRLLDIKFAENSRILKFSLPPVFLKYIIEKGSIAINGISLTVIETKEKYFTVGIIPYTWDNTMLKSVKVGDLVNIEVDILAKYIEKLTKEL